jgi:hypothetical protein
MLAADSADDRIARIPQFFVRVIGCICTIRGSLRLGD